MGPSYSFLTKSAKLKHQNLQQKPEPCYSFLTKSAKLKQLFPEGYEHASYSFLTKSAKLKLWVLDWLLGKEL